MKDYTYFKNKKILITGGLGFTGSNLAHRLVELNAEVTLLDCLLEAHGGNLFNVDDIQTKVRIVQGDIRDEKIVNECVQGQDILFNIAAQTSHTDSIQHPHLDVDINNKGQINLLEACRKLNSNIRVVYCSTRAVYGKGAQGLVNEQAPCHPLDIYAANKFVGEHYHKIYHSVHGLNCVILRMGNSYGPRGQMKQPSFGILNWFTRLAIENQEIKMFGEGQQVRDYIYIEDAVEAFLALASSTISNAEIFNIGSGQGVALVDIVKEILRIAGKGRIQFVPWPEQNKKIDVGDFIADIQKIQNTISWQPTISLSDGIQKMIQYYEKNKQHYW